MLVPHARYPRHVVVLTMVSLLAMPMAPLVAQPAAPRPPDVEYQDGKPKFQPIEQTSAQRAVNTDKDMKVGDHDGNVYRKQGDSWQKYDSGGWNSVQQPTPAQRQQAQQRAAQAGTQAQSRAASSGWDSATAAQVQRDSAARAEGAQRALDRSRVQSSGASRAGSYHASGGASHSSGRQR